MKGLMMNVETLSRPELLTLLSILEGELEAQDTVIHTLRAHHRDSFVQERYGQYDLSDPFLALQRDSQAMDDWSPSNHSDTQSHSRGSAVGPNPLAVLKLVMSHCKRMQERMMGQLAAAESRHRRVIADMEQEKRLHMLESAQNSDVTFVLEKEREKLLQQLEAERATVQRLQKEQERAVGKAEESLSQQQQLSSALTLELQRTTSQALEETQRASQLSLRLQEESSTTESLRDALEAEKGRAVRLETRAEGLLAEFDTEREQLRARIRREEERSRELEREVEELRRRLEGGGEEGTVEEEQEKDSKQLEESPHSKTVASATTAKVSTGIQTDHDGKASIALKVTPVSKVNGHHPIPLRDSDPPQEEGDVESVGAENGPGVSLPSPLHTHLPQQHPHHPHNLSPSSTASSSLSSSPISSPTLTKRLVSPGGFIASSYQAGVNQRFHAARHRFQAQAEQEQLQQASTAPLSPRELSPATTPVPPPPENSAAKQLARNTVTQVLSRFTSQQAGAKLPPPNSSPFGTDYRSIASAPSGGKTSPGGPLSPGIRSPLTPRSEKCHPPPVARKPGMSPTPGSPGPTARASLFPELTGGCGLSSNGQEEAKEPDLVLSSGS